MLTAAVKRIKSAVWVAFSSPQYSVWGLQGPALQQMCTGCTWIATLHGGAV